MNLDNFTRHLGAVTVALLALMFSAAAVWQIIHSHEVDALLAGLVGTTLGYLIPSPQQTGKVTVENDPSDPVPTSAVTTKRRKDAGDAAAAVVIFIAILIAAALLGTFVNHWLFFLLVLCLIVLVV